MLGGSNSKGKAYACGDAKGFFSFILNHGQCLRLEVIRNVDGHPFDDG